jgi:acetyl-CoA acyltransferase
MTTMLNALEDTGGRYGLQVMGVAGGLATVFIVERL